MGVFDLSPEDKEKIGELRKRVEHALTQDVQREDHWLMKWLVARNKDVDKAEEMLKASLDWRKANQVDGILEREEIPEKFQKRYMISQVGEDEHGFPILLVPCGRHDFRIALEECGLETLIKWNIIWIEKLEKVLADVRKKTGKPIFQYHEICDFEHYSVRHLSYKPALDYMAQSTKVYDSNYPESLRTCIIINAPKIFPILFNLFKPMLSKQTMDKICVYGADEDKWKAYLRENFSMERIPPRWGGTLKGSDEFCSQEDIWFHHPIPLRYFKEVEGEDEEGFYTTKIPARDQLKIELDILEQNTRLEWKFQTEVHDIAFGVLFDNPGEKNIPVDRVSSQASVQDGFIICNCKGKVSIIFDNKFSLTTAKTLRYKIDMIPPTAVPKGKWDMQ